MANDTTGNPWVCDSTGEVTAHPTYVKRMVWTPTTDGDDLLVEDNGGSDVWAYKAIAGDSNQSIPYEREFDGLVNGITITTIDNGTLYIYIR